MPKQYEDIRDSYESRGVPEKRAKKLAAMTYNARRAKGVPPVTGKMESLKGRATTSAERYGRGTFRRR